MARNVKLLLIESVDTLGIVGDVVNVRLGYARNFLLPRQLATTPSDELIKSLAAKRAEAERQLAELRKAREETVHKLDGFHIALERPTNDMGILYAAVTQAEIATLLNGMGHKNVRPRDVRLGQTIKRIGSYDVTVKFDTDLEATLKLDVKSDRKLEMLEELQAAEEAARAAAAGQTPAPAAGAAPAEGQPADAAAGEAKPKKAKAAPADAPKADKPAADAAKADKPAKAEKAADKGTDKAEKAGKKDKAKA
jgi:large subunit ribosomal protein L9